MITTGSRLGPYEIAAQLGAGGMGEVYRARDSRLDRTVAIKILPQRLSSDPRLRERFEREAKAISSLAHPHICTLFDVGSHDGTEFLVMEYLEGESLADRLARGPLPIDQVLRYGTEIADALDKAHRAGIVHRDLKPGNIVLTKSGAKLLDFGLAKFAQNIVPSKTDPNAATATMTQQHKALTEEGTIVGTFQYMAPEQIEGREADARTDIFALGAVLYEMATGKRAFEAKTKASLIASILDRDPPPISAIQPLTPPAFERVVRMCLAKDPDERWQNAHDIAAELKWIGASSSDTIGPGVKRRTRRAIARGAALLLAGALLGGAAAWLATRDNEPPRRVARFSIPTPANAPLHLGGASLAISRDGTTIVYAAMVGEHTKLFLRPLDSLAAVPIAGTERAYSPTFSPDGRWIAFFANESLWKVQREGGTPTRLIDNAQGLGISWDGDTIVVNKSFGGGLMSVPANGGTPRQVVKGDPKTARAIVWPDILPGGKTVIATVWNVGSWDTAKIVAYSIEDGSSTVLVDGGSHARYSASGHLLFLRGDNLMAASFDPETLRIGAASSVVNGVAHGTADGEAHYAVSRSGHLVFAPGSGTKPSDQLLWMTRDGKSTPIVPTIRRYGSVAIAPDGRTAAVTIEESTYDIWQLDLERDSLTRVSYGGDDAGGIWNADGTRLLWHSSRNGPYDIYWRAADTGSPEEALVTSQSDKGLLSVTADGQHLVWSERGAGGDIWMMPFATRKPQQVLATQFNEGYPAVSPDGRWLAYASDESGRGEVYLTSFPKPSGKWQVSIEGGIAPKWMPNGRELVFHHGSKWYLVPIELEPRPRPGRPRVIFEGDYDDDYSITRDGRIALVKNGPRPTTTRIDVVLNWGEELKRRVPAR